MKIEIRKQTWNYSNYHRYLLQVVKIIKNMCIFFIYVEKTICCLIVFIFIDNVFVQVHVQLLFHRFFMVFNSWCSGVTTFFIYQPLQTLDQSLLH